jgi:8-oxo-dGTP pyrophosphatase MutT (NUDIX family)
MKLNDLTPIEKMGAGCLITAKDTKNFLLIKRSDYVNTPLTWSLPGGGVDPGEKPIQGAIRETWEEIGFDLSRTTLKLIYSNSVYAPRFKFFTYAAIVDKEFQPKLNWESADYMWTNLDNLPSPLHWGVKQMINFDLAAIRLKDFLEDS